MASNEAHEQLLEIPIGTPSLLNAARWYRIGLHSVRVTSCAGALPDRPFTAEIFSPSGCRVVRGIGVADVLFRARLVVVEGLELGSWLPGRYAPAPSMIRLVAT